MIVIILILDNLHYFRRDGRFGHNADEMLAKVGEQALPIYTLQLYEFIPMLCGMQRASLLTNLTISDVIEDYYDNVKIDKDTEKKELLRYIDHLEEMEQTPEDWNLDLYKWVYDSEAYDFKILPQDFPISLGEDRIGNIALRKRIIENSRKREDDFKRYWNDKYLLNSGA